ncbi:hypothetical protein C0Q70_04890 [Pomacea canaliculata]|uniref:BHLH domain-containing protein n=1 Tax=Pomacea canaliculata TaxID=400727 RepID=A0A2T7PJR5_POMCA|nr:hypothetical protein C0Q70_04890 [Pomacea canaliculata]
MFLFRSLPQMVRFSSGHRPSLTQMAARKQLRKHIRRIREREYSKLRALVPAVATKKKVTKVQVIEEAVRYIEELHAALVERFRQKHGDSCRGPSDPVSLLVNSGRPLRLRCGKHGSGDSSKFCLSDDAPCPTSDSAYASVSHPSRSLSSQSSQLQPYLPVPGFLSSCSYEKQRKRASFLLQKEKKGLLNLLASLLFQTVISLNRFLRVCHLKLHRVLFSRRRTVLLCVLCWMLAVLLALMPLVSSIGCYSFDCNGHVCSLLNNEKQHFTQIVFVASGILPVLAIGYCNWAIYQHWKGTRFKSRSQYTIIQMEIKRLKEKLKSRRRNRKKCKEESIENRWR